VDVEVSGCPKLDQVGHELDGFPDPVKCRLMHKDEEDQGGPVLLSGLARAAVGLKVLLPIYADRATLTLGGKVIGNGAEGLSGCCRRYDHYIFTVMVIIISGSGGHLCTLLENNG